MTAFAELDITDCTCAHCRVHGTGASPGGPTTEPRTHASRSTVRPLFRAAATTAMLAVGGGAALIAAPAASAETAPAHAGWDGQRYWFRSNGEWRWTTHYDVYLQHTGGSAPATDGGIRQGWDGHRYWFRSNGEWRWTTHYDVYLRYTGGGAGSGSGTGSTDTTPSAGGITWGWDGHRYWFRKNGAWRWTTHYDVYLTYAGYGHPTHGPGPGDPGQNPSPDPVPGPVVPPPGHGAGNLETAISFAEAQLGKPYVWGGNGPYGYDCSGLVQQAFFRAGIKLPRVAAEQYRATTPISPSVLRRGDLIFWSSSSRSSGIHHVAIYLGGGRYIEAPHPGADVRISVLSTGYYPDFFGRVS
ncbi:C40 family peptidase [Streptacidiphilus jiangxiensis]|uniref:NlpC/P60 family protein n=1 Tax=Streptacidiphilus jiangxiensis TaxID=235985 RepID=A0A1H7VH62_STRJI|nr:C40 family peptidase [Streptacidiphilus jiangxiensis]SEM08582.1 NlpC/P60 family protein [Streptacidiphilus jiangxiensis]